MNCGKLGISEKHGARRVALAVGALFLLSNRGVALATDWEAGTGDWFTTGNWSSGVPNSSTAAFIAIGGTAQISAMPVANLIDIRKCACTTAFWRL